MNLFCFGMGYSSRAAARAFEATKGAGARIGGTVRAPDAAAGLSAAHGWRVHPFDGTAVSAHLAADLADATHVVISIPPGERGDPVLGVGRSALDAAAGLSWLCYYSTVGVYGDSGGAWVDEDVPPRPVNARSRWRVDAENAWRDYAEARGVPLLILRLAGIYGPGRSALDKLRAGTARRIVKPGQVFNRIHVDDIGRITVLAAQRRLAGTYNLADDEPAPPQDVVAFAAELAGLDPPPEVDFAEADMTPMARSFYADNKRVSSERIKAALGIALLYPSYREGLAAIRESEA